MNAEQILEEQEQLQIKSLLASGVSEEEIDLKRKQKKFRELASLYTFVERTEIEGKPELKHNNNLIEEVGLNLGIALEGLGRRYEAIDALRRASSRYKASVKLQLAYAKLLFRNNEKELSEKVLNSLLRKYKQQQSYTSIDIDDSSVGNNYDSSDDCTSEENDCKIIILEEDGADAFYILGWIKIHGDDHTTAYRIWSEGHRYCPNDVRLKRQQNKVACWSGISKSKDQVPTTYMPLSSLIGSGFHIDGVFSSSDFDCFTVAQDRDEPALHLFDQKYQKRELVFRCKKPILTALECEKIIFEVNNHIANSYDQWPIVRAASVPTTDIAVEDIATLRPWLRCLLSQVLQPMIAACYPKLADGSSVGENGERVKVHDAFIVRYDAENSTSLPAHCDTSAISFTVALNPIHQYDGGGTWFEVLDNPITADQGQAVAFAGPLRHGGYPISKGVRYILVLFLYIENFAYGQYISRDASDCAIRNKKSIDENGGNEIDKVTAETINNEKSYVVYRETVELMTTLNKDYIDLDDG